MTVAQQAIRANRWKRYMEAYDPPTIYFPEERQPDMSWTEEVKCRGCGDNQWSVRDGEWTCPCGRPMHDPRNEMRTER